MDDYRGQEHNPKHGQWHTGNGHHGQPNTPLPPHQHLLAHGEGPQARGQNAGVNAGRGYDPNGMDDGTGSSASTTVADAQRLLSVYPFASATPTSHGMF